jgi:methionyl-tRNA synthetase
MPRFYLTTPLYYPNARPHVGSAYTTIVCDAIARYQRMCGYDVAFLTGTDEHGEKLERAAAEAGQSPGQFVAEKRELFRELWKRLDIRYTHFVYTDQAEHVKSVQRMLLRAREAGYIDKRRYEGRYCVFDEMYVAEGSEPVNCPNCGRPAELISEENYFFRLSAFQERLLRHYEEHPEFVQPDFRMNEVKSFVGQKGGLRDISVSRKRIRWGIPWPDDPEQVFYVWYDALTGYLTGIGFAEGENGSAQFQKYWPADLHMIGKDILRFHAIYWPAFLMAANMPLPKTVFAHGWIYYEQDKMSKSKGNVVYPEPIVKLLGNDALRYYLLRDTPFGLDGSFSYEGLVQRYNSDLANDLGNLASRVITMIHRYANGVVPKPDMELTLREEELKVEFFSGSMQTGTTTLTKNIGETERYRLSFDGFLLQMAVTSVWELISMMNRYLVVQQPWKLAESDNENDQALLALVLYTAADLLRTIAVMLCSIIPCSAERLWKQLGCEGRLEDQRIDQLAWGQLQPGAKVGKPEPIFPRLDKEATLRKLNELAEQDRAADQKLQEARKQLALEHERDLIPETDAIPGPETRVPSPEPRTPGPETAKITIDDFAKVDLRAGTIVSAAPVPGATKLLKLQVDIGTEVRQVCAGLAEYYKPEQLTGMKVVLVANLQPRKLRGVESNGMIVAASVGEEGRPVLATFNEDVENGARLK